MRIHLKNVHSKHEEIKASPKVDNLSTVESDHARNKVAILKDAKTPVHFKLQNVSANQDSKEKCQQCTYEACKGNIEKTHKHCA